MRALLCSESHRPFVPASADRSSPPHRGNQVLHDPREPQATRQQAHYVCEGVKADDGQAFMTAAALVVPTMPPTVRHFGYQLYEHLIAKRWGALDESSKAQLKAVSLQVCPARLTPRLPRGRARRSCWCVEPCFQAFIECSTQVSCGFRGAWSPIFFGWAP